MSKLTKSERELLFLRLTCLTGSGFTALEIIKDLEKKWLEERKQNLLEFLKKKEKGEHDRRHVPLI